MKDFLQYLLQNIVSDPQSVTVTETESEEVVTYDITVSQDDSGAVIGKGGRIINALRTLLSASQTRAGNDRKRIFLNITPSLPQSEAL